MYKDSDPSQLMEFTEEVCDSGEFAVWNKIGGDLLWNSVPQSIQVLPKHKFKASLHQLLMNS